MTFFITTTICTIAAVASLGMVGLFIVMMRRVHRLELLLGHLCIQTFAQQHLPIWRFWSQAFDYTFKVSIVRPGSDNMSDTREDDP